MRNRSENLTPIEERRQNHSICKTLLEVASKSLSNIPGYRNTAEENWIKGIWIGDPYSNPYFTGVYKISFRTQNGTFYKVWHGRNDASQTSLRIIREEPKKPAKAIRIDLDQRDSKKRGERSSVRTAEIVDRIGGTPVLSLYRDDRAIRKAGDFVRDLIAEANLGFESILDIREKLAKLNIVNGGENSGGMAFRKLL